jgi:hypothetical protein
MKVNVSNIITSISELIEFTLFTVEDVRKIPKETGVYVMLDSKNRVLYVGESNDIRRRIQTHICKGSSSAFKNEVAYIGVVVSELNRYERILLESLLILELEPSHNIQDGDLKYDNQDGNIQRKLASKGRKLNKGLFYTIREEIKKGLSNKEIAKKYELHRNTVSNVARLTIPTYQKWEEERLTTV